MKIDTTKLKLALPAIELSESPVALLAESRMAQRSWSLQSRSERLRAQAGSQASKDEARIRPPRGSRIYSDSELKSATQMFLKLKGGEDRRPRPEASRSEIPGPIDPMERVLDTLLDLVGS